MAVLGTFHKLILLLYYTSTNIIRDFFACMDACTMVRCYVHAPRAMNQLKKKRKNNPNIFIYNRATTWSIFEGPNLKEGMIIEELRGTRAVLKGTS